MESKIKAGIVGGAGYTGGELIRILLNHPHVKIEFVHSNSNAGNPLHHVHTDLLGESELLFTNQLSQDIDVLFLCLGHGDSEKFLNENKFDDHIKIIDLSQDFRLTPNNQDFIYGLPELNKVEIRKAKKVANPGCFATCIQLALLPLAKNNLLKDDIHISGITGSTGAGQSFTLTSHFSWRNNNISAYKAFTHQHLKEIKQSLKQVQPSYVNNINFIPYRGNFTRGIMVTIYFKSDMNIAEIQEMYNSYYQEAPFTVMSGVNPNLKQVVNTNKAVVYVEKAENNLLIICAIDNLLKGASGQAVQNMNLMFGLEETAGLKLKAIGF